MAVNQQSGTVTIIYQNVKSVVNSFSLYFTARLLTLFNENNIDRVTTKAYSSYFTFTNQNCNYLYSNYTNYLVINKLTVFAFEFEDEENDKPIIVVNSTFSNDNFVNKLPNAPNCVYLIIQATEIAVKPVELIISYTDSYHQDSSLFKNISIELNLFEVEPPIFNSSLIPIHANKCSNFIYKLPNIFDQNDLHCNVSFSSKVQNWIVLDPTDNSITLNTTGTADIPQLTLIELKVENEKNAWTKYNLTIEVDSISTPYFDLIPDMKINTDECSSYNIPPDEILAKSLNIISQTNVLCIECDSHLIIPAISYSHSNSNLNIVGSKLTLNNTCAILKSKDSCGNWHYSNNFKITKITNQVPAVVNTFGPLTIFINNKNLFLIPPDLSIVQSNSTPKYSCFVVYCSSRIDLINRIEYSKENDLFYLLLQSSSAGTCQLTILISDSEDNSSEILVEVFIKRCASINCLECTDQYQSNCTKCDRSFVLKSDGACLQNTDYYPTYSTTLDCICGVIVMLSIIIQILLSFKYGLKLLVSCEYAQLIIIYVASCYNNQNLLEFISWIQFTKMDFAFIIKFDYFYQFHSIKTNSTRMESIKFYYNSSVLNFANLLLFFMMLILSMLILKWLSSKLLFVMNFYKFLKSKIKNERIIWLILHVFLQFILISIVNDAINFKQQTAATIISICIVLCFLICILFSIPELFSLPFIEKLEICSPSFYCLIVLAKVICNACLFAFEGNKMHIICISISLALQLISIIVHIWSSREYTLKEIYERYSIVIKNSMITVILILIFIDEVFSNSNLNCRTIVILTTVFFVGSLFLDILTNQVMIQELQ